MAKTTVKKLPQEMDLMKLFERFGPEDKCRTYLEGLRWADGIRCIRCQSDKISRIYGRNQFHCDVCKYQFSVTTGTIFHDTHLPLPKWFAAIYLMCESRKVISANHLKRTLSVAYKTAWYLCHRIRAAVKDADTTPRSETVEVDETFLGGKAKYMHARVRAEKIKGRGTAGKAMALAMIQRGGQVRIKVESQRDRETLHAFIRNNSQPETKRIMTDEWEAYQGIADADTSPEKVNHSANEYVRGDVHTNTVEGVFSLFKRSVVGAYHQVSTKHIERYLDEFEFRFNNRDNPYLFRDTLLKLISS